MKKELTKRIISSIILIPIVLFFIISGSFLFNLFITICFIITAYEWYMMSKKKIYNLIGLMFLILSFYLVYILRNDFPLDYFLITTIICISTDMGGYIFGKVFKGPKLTKLSPNKTYAGMIGGYLLAIMITSLILNNILFFINKTEITLNLETIVFIILVSTTSQFGDIFISYFKRKSKIKDTGKIIPGHGGLLDRIDGMIFAFPFSYIILRFDII